MQPSSEICCKIRSESLKCSDAKCSNAKHKANAANGVDSAGKEV